MSNSNRNRSNGKILRYPPLSADGVGPEVSPSPKVSLVIPARNAGSTIAATLESALAQDYAGDIDIVIADGSDDHSMWELVNKKFSQVTTIINHRKTIPSGLNRAIEGADGEVIARCDAHTILPSDYIRHSVELLFRLAAEGVVCVGGRAIPVGASLFGRAVARAVMSPVASGNSRYKVGGASGPVDTVYLGVFWRASWAKVGGYDESLEANEDYELNWRFRQAGGIVWFDSRIQATYRPRDNPAALAVQGFKYGRWKAAMLLRNPRSARVRQLAPPAALVCMVAASVCALVTGHVAVLALWPALYLILSGIELARSLKRWDSALLLLPLVLPIMHVSWAVGFFLPRKAVQKSGGGGGKS